MPSARVAALTRYPVTSLAGEALAAAVIGARGLDGDRSWAVRTEDGGIGSGETTRRFRRVDGLLGLTAGTDGAGDVPGSGFPEEEWAGCLLALGDEVVLRPDGGLVRCRMVDLVGSGAAGDGLLTLLGRERDTVFGIRALVERGGTVRVGDDVSLR